MKCPHCQEEVAESGFIYCPHCGKELKASQDKVNRIFNWHIVVWPVLTWLIVSGICYWLDKSDPAMESVRVPGTVFQRRDQLAPSNPLEWAPLAWWITAAAILYIVGIWIIYQHATRYSRNAVRWTTAAIIFTPVLAWAAYGLSWRKGQQ